MNSSISSFISAEIKFKNLKIRIEYPPLDRIEIDGEDLSEFKKIWEKYEKRYVISLLRPIFPSA